MSQDKGAVRKLIDKIPPYPDGEDTPVYDTDTVEKAMRKTVPNVDRELLEVIPHMENDGIIDGREMLKVLHSARIEGGVNVSDVHSFEVWFDRGEFRFLLSTPSERARDRFERRISNIYTDSEIDPIEKGEAFPTLDAGMHRSAVYLDERRHTFLPIRHEAGDGFESVSDPYADVLGEMAALDNSIVVLQIIFKPAPKEWTSNGPDGQSVEDVAQSLREGDVESLANPSAWMPFHELEEREPSKKDKEAAKIVENQRGQRGFHTNIRVMAASPQQEEALERTRGVAEMFAKYYNTGTEQGLQEHPINETSISDQFTAMIERDWVDREVVLSVDELAGLAHIPNKEIEVPGIQWRQSQTGTETPSKATKDQSDGAGVVEEGSLAADRSTTERTTPESPSTPESDVVSPVERSDQDTETHEAPHTDMDTDTTEETDTETVTRSELPIALQTSVDERATTDAAPAVCQCDSPAIEYITHDSDRDEWLCDGCGRTFTAPDQTVASVLPETVTADTPVARLYHTHPQQIPTEDGQESDTDTDGDDTGLLTGFFGGDSEKDEPTSKNASQQQQLTPKVIYPAVVAIGEAIISTEPVAELDLNSTSDIRPLVDSRVAQPLSKITPDPATVAVCLYVAEQMDSSARVSHQETYELVGLPGMDNHTVPDQIRSETVDDPPEDDGGGIWEAKDTPSEIGDASEESGPSTTVDVEADDTGETDTTPTNTTTDTENPSPAPSGESSEVQSDTTTKGAESGTGRSSDTPDADEKTTIADQSETIQPTPDADDTDQSQEEATTTVTPEPISDHPKDTDSDPEQTASSSIEASDADPPDNKSLTDRIAGFVSNDSDESTATPEADNHDPNGAEESTDGVTIEQTTSTADTSSSETTTVEDDSAPESGGVDMDAGYDEDDAPIQLEQTEQPLPSITDTKPTEASGGQDDFTAGVNGGNTESTDNAETTITDAAATAESETDAADTHATAETRRHRPEALPSDADVSTLDDALEAQPASQESGETSQDDNTPTSQPVDQTDLESNTVSASSQSSREAGQQGAADQELVGRSDSVSTDTSDVEGVQDSISPDRVEYTHNKKVDEDGSLFLTQNDDLEAYIESTSPDNPAVVNKDLVHRLANEIAATNDVAALKQWEVERAIDEQTVVDLSTPAIAAPVNAAVCATLNSAHVRDGRFPTNYAEFKLLSPAEARLRDAYLSTPTAPTPDSTEDETPTDGSTVTVGTDYLTTTSNKAHEPLEGPTDEYDTDPYFLQQTDSDENSTTEQIGPSTDAGTSNKPTTVSDSSSAEVESQDRGKNDEDTATPDTASPNKEDDPTPPTRSEVGWRDATESADQPDSTPDTDDTSPDERPPKPSDCPHCDTQTEFSFAPVINEWECDECKATIDLSGGSSTTEDDDDNMDDSDGETEPVGVERLRETLPVKQQVRTEFVKDLMKLIPAEARAQRLSPDTSVAELYDIVDELDANGELVSPEDVDLPAEFSNSPETSEKNADQADERVEHTEESKEEPTSKSEPPTSEAAEDSASAETLSTGTEPSTPSVDDQSSTAEEIEDAHTQSEGTDSVEEVTDTSQEGSLPLHLTDTLGDATHLMEEPSQVLFGDNDTADSDSIEEMKTRWSDHDSIHVTEQSTADDTDSTSEDSTEAGTPDEDNDVVDAGDDVVDDADDAGGHKDAVGDSDDADQAEQQANEDASTDPQTDSQTGTQDDPQ
jgi:ribosomal protein L37AE/L43A